MQYADHSGPLRLSNVEDEVRETRDDGASDVSIDDRTCLWMITDKLQLLPQSRQILLTETRALRFVPFKRGLDVAFSPWA